MAAVKKNVQKKKTLGGGAWHLATTTPPVTIIRPRITAYRERKEVN